MSLCYTPFVFKVEVIAPLSGVALIGLGIYLLTETELFWFGLFCVAIGITTLLFSVKAGKFAVISLIAALVLLAIALLAETNCLREQQAQISPNLKQVSLSFLPHLS